jgi:hypothetical protein
MGHRYRQGEHICGLYETKAEQLEAAADYLADGLRAGERAFYVAESDAALGRFRAALKQVGIDVSSVIREDALVELTHAEAHLFDGVFNTERMIGFLNDSVEAALNDGFTGLRACGDMSWLLQDAPGADQVVEYEALLNQFFRHARGAAMCQYDRRRLPAALIDHALATHTSAVLEGRHRPNPFYLPPSIAITRKARPSLLTWKISELRRRS